MPQKLNDSVDKVHEEPISIGAQVKRMQDIEMDQYYTGVEIDTIKKQEIAPELCPAINKPTEVQDLRKIDKAEKVDIQEWIETAVEVLPEISIEIQKLNEEMAPAANIDHQ